MQELRGRCSETKQEVVCMKSARRGFIAGLSTAISLGLFNLCFAFQKMVSCWVQRVKGSFNYEPEWQAQAPAAAQLLSGKGEHAPGHPQWFHRNSAHPQHSQHLTLHVHHRLTKESPLTYPSVHQPQQSRLAAVSQTFGKPGLSERHLMQTAYVPPAFFLSPLLHHEVQGM